MVISPCSLLSHCSVWQTNPRAGFVFPLCVPADPPGTGLCPMLTTNLLLSVLLPAWCLKLRNVKFPHSANTCGKSLIVLAIRELALGLEALWCLMEAIYFAALSCLFPILQLHTAFPSHSCHWELQCEMGYAFHGQIYIIHEVKNSSVSS